MKDVILINRLGCIIGSLAQCSNVGWGGGGTDKCLLVFSHVLCHTILTMMFEFLATMGKLKGSVDTNGE